MSLYSLNCMHVFTQYRLLHSLAHDAAVCRLAIICSVSKQLSPRVYVYGGMCISHFETGLINFKVEAG